jgi:group I intron endonuclease
VADPKVPGIYAIRNLTNGKVYVGSAINIAARWKLHRTNLRGGKHHSKPLQRSWDKYGLGSFVFEVLELCPSDALVKREQHWMDCLRALAAQDGYNVAPNAGSILGIKRSAETRAKLSKAREGFIFRPEHIAAMVAGWRNRAPATPETRAKISATTKGRVKSPEERERLSAALKGRVPSVQCLAASRLANKGKQISEAARTALRKANIGRPRPDVAERMRQKWATRRKLLPHRQPDLFDAHRND